jgi:phosphatidylglycerol---prolipoprotein diacylglyceryl transferase
MLPELWRIPFLDVRLPTYGLLLAIAFVISICVAARLAERDGLGWKAIYDLGFYVVPGCLIGTKGLGLLAGAFGRSGSLNSLAHDSPAVGAYWGGLLISLAASLALTKLGGLSWLRVADAVAPALALGNVVGRLGCLAGGCCWGVPTRLWIGVSFGERAHELTGVPIDTALMPTQLIQSALNVLWFVVLLRLWRRREFPGQVIFGYLVLYSLERISVGFWRTDPVSGVLGLSYSQLISLVVLPIALLSIIYLSKRHKEPESHLVLSQQLNRPTGNP